MNAPSNGRLRGLSACVQLGVSSGTGARAKFVGGRQHRYLGFAVAVPAFAARIGSATCRPDDPRQARLGPRPKASRAARGLGPPRHLARQRLGDHCAASGTRESADRRGRRTEDTTRRGVACGSRPRLSARVGPGNTSSGRLSARARPLGAAVRQALAERPAGPPTNARAGRPAPPLRRSTPRRQPRANVEPR
jgi:hypothetical protein